MARPARSRGRGNIGRAGTLSRPRAGRPSFETPTPRQRSGSALLRNRSRRQGVFLLGRRVRRLKDVAPSIVLRRALLPAGFRRLIAKTNVIPSPHQIARRGLLAMASAEYRQRVARAKECKRKVQMRRRMVFKHGGAGHGHHPSLKLRHRGC